jgi:gliding motility-associated-like protein
MRKKFFLVIFLLCIVTVLYAQQLHEQTNAGTDFWVTSMHVAQYFPSEEEDYQGFYDTDSLYVAIASQLTQTGWSNDRDSATLQIVGVEECFGYVTNPTTGWRIDFHVVPGSITEIMVPEAQIMCYESTEIQRKGCHIHTECEVWAYLLSNKNKTRNPSEPEPVMHNLQNLERRISKIQLAPVQTYQDEYYLANTLVTFGGWQHLSYFIVATEDDTQITIPPHWEYHDYSPVTPSLEDCLYVEAQTFFLNEGDVLPIWGIIPDSMAQHQYSYLPIQTNCHPVVVYCGYTDNPDYMHFMRNPVASFFNLYNPKGSGKDFVWAEIESPVPTHLINMHPECNREILHSWVNNWPFWPEGVFFDFGGNEDSLGYFCLEHAMPIFYQWIEVGYQNIRAAGLIAPYPAADRCVKEVLLPTRTDPFSNRMKFFLSVCVPPEGIASTYLNGEQIPSSFFRTLPEISDRYYVACFTFYNNDIPRLLHITNPVGFSAILQEISFDSTSRVVSQWTLCGSGSTYPDNINVGDTLNACVGDTLHLTTHLYCGHAPLVWLVDGVEYRQDELFLPVENADTLTILMIEEKFCQPDTTYHVVCALAPPHITLCADTVICHGASITAQSDVSGVWQWSDSTESATFFPQEEGEYVVHINNDCGSDSATINVRFYNDPLAVDFGNDTLLCQSVSVLLDATQQHPASYLWQDQSTNTTYLVIDDGQYWVVVTDNCTGASDTINIDYLYDFQVYLGNDTTICSNHPYTLDATTPYSRYLWHDGTTAPTHEVTTTGTYSVHVYNACGEADASVTVEVEDCGEAVHVPNAFTPNGDGQNDLFLPVFNHPERLESYRLHVFDRWGRLMFSTDNPHQGWKCDECPVGVYVWRMEYKASGEGGKILTGNVTVVR